MLFWRNSRTLTSLHETVQSLISHQIFRILILWLKSNNLHRHLVKPCNPRVICRCKLKAMERLRAQPCGSFVVNERGTQHIFGASLSPRCNVTHSIDGVGCDSV